MFHTLSNTFLFPQPGGSIHQQSTRRQVLEHTQCCAPGLAQLIRNITKMALGVRPAPGNCCRVGLALHIGLGASYSRACCVTGVQYVAA